MQSRCCQVQDYLLGLIRVQYFRYMRHRIATENRTFIKLHLTKKPYHCRLILHIIEDIIPLKRQFLCLSAINKILKRNLNQGWGKKIQLILHNQRQDRKQRSAEKGLIEKKTKVRKPNRKDEESNQLKVDLLDRSTMAVATPSAAP